LIFILLLLFQVIALEGCAPGVWILKPDINESIRILNNKVVEITRSDINLRVEDAVLQGGPIIFPNWVFVHVAIVNNRPSSIIIDPEKFEMEIRDKKILALAPDQPVPRVYSEFKRIEYTKLYPSQSIEGYVFFKDLKFPFKDSPVYLRVNKIVDEATKEEINFEIILKRIY